MKSGIHPEYKPTTFNCSCGASWKSMSTLGQETTLKSVPIVILFTQEVVRGSSIRQVGLRSSNAATIVLKPPCWKSLERLTSALKN